VECLKEWHNYKVSLQGLRRCLLLMAAQRNPCDADALCRSVCSGLRRTTRDRRTAQAGLSITGSA
jgi:hypothetical protein